MHERHCGLVRIVGAFIRDDLSPLPSRERVRVRGRHDHRSHKVRQNPASQPNRHRTRTLALAPPRSAAAGVKSERAFQLQSLLVSVTMIADVILLLPTRNGGASGNEKGFHTLEDQAIEVLAKAASERLVAALNQAVNKSLR